MAHFLKGRVSMLETRNSPPARVRHTVLTFDARTGRNHRPEAEWQVHARSAFRNDERIGRNNFKPNRRRAFIESAHIEGMSQ